MAATCFAVFGCGTLEDPISPSKGCGRIKNAVSDVCGFTQAEVDDVIACEELTACGSSADEWEGEDVDREEQEIRDGECEDVLENEFEIACVES